MAVRFRKSAPGVRFNVGKTGASVRVGDKGLGYTTGTLGQRVSAGLPGTQKVGTDGGSGVLHVKPWILTTILMGISGALGGCGDLEPAILPPEVQSFIAAHPELGLAIEKIERAPDWARGLRWRARAGGKTIIIYERAGEVESIKRADQTFLWDRAGR